MKSRAEHVMTCGAIKVLLGLIDSIFILRPLVKNDPKGLTSKKT